MQASEVSGASEASEARQGVPASAREVIWGWMTCPSQAHCLKASLYAFSGLCTFVLTYLALVSHLNKVWSVILQCTLVGHVESVI